MAGSEQSPPKPYFPFTTFSGPMGFQFRYQDANGVVRNDPDYRGYDTEYEATKGMRRFCITRGENPNVPWPYNNTVNEVQLDLSQAA